MTDEELKTLMQTRFPKVYDEVHRVIMATVMSKGGDIAEDSQRYGYAETIEISVLRMMAGVLMMSSQLLNVNLIHDRLKASVDECMTTIMTHTIPELARRFGIDPMDMQYAAIDILPGLKRGLDGGTGEKTAEEEA